MPYANKRKANIEKLLKQEASKCQKVSDFFTKNENARTSSSTSCDTNVEKESEQLLNMAPIEVESEVQGTAATEGTDQGEPRKDNELNEVDFDIRNSDREGNVQFVHTRAPSNNIPSNTTPSTLSSTSSENINSITLVTTSDVGLPISTANTSSTQMTTETTTEYYRGYPLNLKALLGKFGDGVLSQYYERSRVSTQNRQKARGFVKCCICGEFEEEAKRFSANGRVYMAQGVRCDGKKKIQDVIDHLLGPSHRAAQEKKQLSKLWHAKDKRHPFINLATKSDPTVLKTLTEMAVEVYNDSKSLTLAAWSWPGRSLANLHAQQQFRSLTDSDNVQSFIPFKPSGEELHYRDPMHYAEMLEIIGDTERKHLREELQNCICFAAQMDGSVDARQHDKKFIFVPFNTPEDPLSIKTRFASASARERTKRGAEGLCSAMTNCFDDMGLSKECLQSKCVGMSTDGESANTGKDSGLWARVENYVGRSTRNIWCACHRSDLAMEDVMRLIVSVLFITFNQTRLNEEQTEIYDEVFYIGLLIDRLHVRIEQIHRNYVHYRVNKFGPFKNTRFSQHFEKKMVYIIRNISFDLSCPLLKIQELPNALRDKFADNVRDPLLRKELKRMSNKEMDKVLQALEEQHPTIIFSVASRTVGGEGADSHSIPERIIGKCPVAVVNIGGVSVSCLLDSGSEVSTITEEFFNTHFKPKGQELLSTSGWLKLTAANGLEIPNLGYFEVDIEAFGLNVPRRGILVVKDSANDAMRARKRDVPGLLGMNVLCEMGQSQPIQAAKRRANTSVRGIVRVAGKRAVRIPASSVTTIPATGWGGQVKCEMAMVEPVVGQHLSHLVVLNTVVRPSSPFCARVANLTNDDLWIQPRTRIGVLHAVSNIESGVEFKRV
ncbi:Retrovirus-related Pol poly from transposon 297 [Paramuricea clavata]|uniref:Retrovirus-related Pol poly from transposon 297 n=1 Tax=Paramuricea clavata TaxID=317549 RepID=A0A6S7JDE9_PARCT|nr:Retrovirus-related Pol poly from transposon 297 [Paramuricea clavata]